MIAEAAKKSGLDLEIKERNHLMLVGKVKVEVQSTQQAQVNYQPDVDFTFADLLDISPWLPPMPDMSTTDSTYDLESTQVQS